MSDIASDAVPGENVSDVTIAPTDYTALTGEELKSTLDISTWETGVKALQAYERLEREIEQAAVLSGDLRKAIREHVFQLLRSGTGLPAEAGVYQATLNQVKEAQRNVLFNGLVEACDGNSHVFHTLPIQIIQIAVAAVSYMGEESTWANRIFRRDIPLKSGHSILDQTIELLSRRAGDKEESSGRRKVSEMMRRGLMTYMERAVLAEKAKAPWRMGHGNPLAYEILTGSGIADLVRFGVDVLNDLVLMHKKFVFVPSETNKEHFLTIGDALKPLEYAVISDCTDDLERLLQGGYRGEWETIKNNYLEPFCKQAGPDVVMGVYRASSIAPAKMFYAHKDYVHEAALIALGDSVMQEHRGCPMLIDMADGICRTYFGAETLNKPVQYVLAQSGEAYRYLDERVTRN
jgi:hypothetical protein